MKRKHRYFGFVKDKSCGEYDYCYLEGANDDKAYEKMVEAWQMQTRRVYLDEYEIRNNQ